MQKQEAKAHALTILERSVQRIGPSHAHNYYRFLAFTSKEKNQIMDELDKLVEKTLKRVDRMKEANS